MHFQSSFVIAGIFAAFAQAALGTLNIRQARCQPNPKDIVFSGGQFCMGFGPGSGNSCFQVPDGCIAVKPIDNTIPSPICADGSKQTLINVPAASAAPPA